MNKCTVYTDHSALKYLFAKKDSKARLLRWVSLSRFDFDNPHENRARSKGDKMKSSYLETLVRMLLDESEVPHGLADNAKLHAGHFVNKGMSTQQQKSKFFKDVKHYTEEEKIPFCLKSVRIKLFDVVFLAKKPMTSSWLAIMVPPVDITVLTTQQEKSSIPDSFGPQSTKMPMSWLKTATHASVKEKFHNVMRCHKIPSKFVKSLTSGALTLWGHSHHPKATNTSFSGPLIIYQNGM
ncbi:hypothetical protein Tco_0794265 [Tanacetum coccineum]